jgi:hypothetical protein
MVWQGVVVSASALALLALQETMDTHPRDTLALVLVVVAIAAVLLVVAWRGRR